MAELQEIAQGTVGASRCAVVGRDNASAAEQIGQVNFVALCDAEIGDGLGHVGAVVGGVSHHKCKGVSSCATCHGVGARACKQQVIACATTQAVIACATAESIGTITPQQGVDARGAIDQLVVDQQGAVARLGDSGTAGTVGCG